MVKRNRRFCRLSTKFIFGISGILVLTLAASLFLNSQVAERYYLSRQTDTLKQSGELLKEYLEQGTEPDDAVSRLEAMEKVLVVYAANTSDYDGLSSALREEFRQKGLGFQKYWLWDQDYLSAIQKGSQFRLYRQDKLNYAILAEYLSVNGNLYAIASIVPDTGDFVKLINQFSLFLYGVSLLLAIGCIFLLVRHITNPLRKIEQFSRGLSRREYGQLDIKTADELELVAYSMNQMSASIQEYQTMLLAKNQQMKQLLDDVAHDLKTPISLIGMYALGMKDGLDDGTFLETILRQNEKMSKLVESLLSLSRVDRKEYPSTRVFLSRLFKQCMEEQSILIKERSLRIDASLMADAEVTGNPELIHTLFSNLLSNSIKYASSGVIRASLTESEEGRFRFLITNEFQNDELDAAQIWEPFYVGEASRNKALSGTGLGLAIVKRIADRYGYTARCLLEGHNISFEIIF